jgi:hypothetical protein
MASSDWTVLTDSQGLSDIDRGPTAGIARPNGGGDFVYGFNSISLTPGAVALHANQTGFAPMSSGASVRGAIQRGLSSGPENFAPFFFAGLQGTTISGVAYMLGLGDADPHHIVLAKGILSAGLQDVEPASGNGVLLRSTEAYEPGTWLHLRLDVIVQASGDVLLQVYQSDLSQHPVTSPVWAVVPGMEGAFTPSFMGYVDDALGVNTGSQPLVGGRAGFGFQKTDTQRRGYFDHVQIGRQ